MTPPYAMPKTTAAARKLQASRVKRYEKTIAAWRARPATRVRLAPKRSARRPEPIRPAIDESPETPRTVADHQARPPPVVERREPAGEGREEEHPGAAPGGDDAHGEAAVGGEPLRRRRGERRQERARGESHGDTERHVELPERGRLARQDQARAQEHAAGDRDTTAAEPVRERAPEEGAEPHRDPVRQRDQRDGAPAPAHRVLERLQEDAEREERPLPDRDDRGGRREDDPAVEESALTHGRELR